MARGLQDVSRSKGIALLVSLGAARRRAPGVLATRRTGCGRSSAGALPAPAHAWCWCLLSAFAFLSGSSTDGGLPLPGVLAWVIGVGIAAAASVSLWVHAHRYAAGNERGLFDIDLVLEWTGLLSIPLPVTVGVGVVASVIFVALHSSVFDVTR